MQAVVPAHVATIGASFCSPVERPLIALIIPTLLVALGIKICRVPDRWLGDLSFSPLHSHSLWHCGIWLAQLMYYRVYVVAIAERAERVL